MMVIDAIHWNVDPEIFGFWKLSVRWYGLLFAASFFFGYLIFLRIFKKENLSVELLDSLTIYMAIGVIVGARLGHCFFYEPKVYLANPIEILYIWKGGLASHGASIGILIALYMFTRKHGKPFIWIMDRIVIAVSLAAFFIRMGNLMNSEIYGIETSLPWGFVFEQRNEIVPKHPTQIYEALAYLFIFFLMYFLYFKKIDKIKPGLMFGIFLILLFTSRFFIEFIKETQVDFEDNLSLKMGQWLSIPFALAGFAILFWPFKKQAVSNVKGNISATSHIKKKKPK